VGDVELFEGVEVAESSDAGETVRLDREDFEIGKSRQILFFG